MKVRLEQRLGQIIDLIEAKDPDAVHYGPATVRSLKIGKRDITVWKQLAEIPDSDLERYFSIISESGETISTKKVLTERAEDPLLMVVDSIRGMAECGDEEGAHAAIRHIQSLLKREPKPVVNEPMPKDFSNEDVFRARGMGNQSATGRPTKLAAKHESPFMKQTCLKCGSELICPVCSGRKTGAAGGRAAALSMTAKERSDRARKAAVSSAKVRKAKAMLRKSCRQHSRTEKEMQAG